MTNVLILKNGTPVKRVTDKYELNPHFDIDGFLTRFINEKTQKKYFYVSKYDFLIEHQNDSIFWIKGYCEEEKFKLYVKGLISLAQLKWREGVNGNFAEYGLNENWFDNQFEIAEENDVAEVAPILIKSPYNKYFQSSLYSFIIERDTSGNVKNYDNNNDGFLDNIPELEPIHNNRLNGTIDGGFYNNHIINNVKFNLLSDEQKKRNLSRLVTKISMRIYRIVEDIFPIFESGELPDSQIVVLVNQLKTNWQNQVIIDGIDYGLFDTYYNTLIEFYKSTKYKDFTNVPSALKVSELSKILPSSVLKNIFSYEQLINILISLFIEIKPNGEYILLRTNINKSEEDYALKIINSVRIEERTQVDGFMDSLYSVSVKTGNSLPPYKYTLFTLLYESIKDYSTPIESVAEFVDIVLPNNRKRLMASLLYIWEESKYNPNNHIDQSGNINFTFFEEKYDYSSQYKPPIIKYINEKSNLGIKRNLFGYNNKPIISFSFESFGEGIYWITEDTSNTIESNMIYHLYQPVTIINFPSETDCSVALPKIGDDLAGGVPIFYLKYIDNSDNEQEFWDNVGLFVDIVSTFAGIGIIAKLRYLRYLSKLGQIGTVIGVVQFSSGVINLILTHADACDDSPFCRKLRTLLTIIEISSLITDPIILFKTKKSAQLVVQEGVDSGWPSSMLNNVDGTTPQQKIMELASQDIEEYFSQYIDIAKSRLEIKLNASSNSFNINLYSLTEREEFFRLAAEEGLSNNNAIGIIHQASRKMYDNLGNEISFIPPSIQELGNRIDTFLLVKTRKYPYPFTSKGQFKIYYNDRVVPFLDMFSLPKRNVKFCGSGVTSPTSFGGGVQDTDWVVYFKDKDEFLSYQYLMRDRMDYYMKNGGLSKGNITELEKRKAKLESVIKSNLTQYPNNPEKWIMYKNHIVTLHNGKVKSLASRDLFDDFFGGTFSGVSNKTDITPKLEGYIESETLPAIDIKEID